MLGPPHPHPAGAPATASSARSATTRSRSSRPTPTRRSRSTRPPPASASRRTCSRATSVGGTRTRSASRSRSRRACLVRPRSLPHSLGRHLFSRAAAFADSLHPLATVQLQKAEEPSADLLEFDHVKDHLEPFLRRSQAQSGVVGAAGASSTGASASAASAQLYKDIPGFSSRYGGSGSLFASTTSRARHGAHGGDASTAPDELEPYKSLYPARGGGPGSEKENRRARAASDKGKGVDRDAQMVQAMRGMSDMEHVASLDKRWMSGWNMPVLSRCVRCPATTSSSSPSCTPRRADALALPVLQRSTTAPHAPAGQALEALPRLRPHPHQARAEVVVDPV